MKFRNILPRLSLKKAQRKRVKRWLRFSPVALALVVSALLLVVAWPKPAVNVVTAASMPTDLRKDYGKVMQSVRALEKRQQDQHNQIVTETDLNGRLSVIQLDAASGHFQAAKSDIDALRKALDGWNFELSGNGYGEVAAQQQPAATPSRPAGTYLPILLYHYPPPNFDQQLAHLQQAGYTTIDLDQALSGLRGGPLPAKPVVITFDDGFSAQMSAYNDLLRRNMKATFYIIDGGEASRWCLGAGRRYNDPLQPPSGCGDAYLTWDQVRTMDRSGLITIAGHTINHRNLASLSAADQRFEIETGKQQLEAELGHSIRHFAYPYGTYNALSIQLVREAGYVTAVTTEAGAYQLPGSDLTLRRVRDAMTLN
jgi:peptidoglycan/xylan/chitin deacetylase (PgdA/CDA1 family)